MEIKMKNYAVIVGHGRSGTNWLLGLFDLSEKTYCRNEPHELLNSPVRKFESYRVVVRKNQEDLTNNWDETIAEEGNRMGIIDEWIKIKKSYFNARKIIYYVLRSNKLRALLSVFFKKLRNDEWLLPEQAVIKSEWKKAYRVFKFIQSPGFVDFLLRKKNNAHIFHIVRHPGGFLNSWKNRYLTREEKKFVHSNNLSRLHDVANEDENWAKQFGDIDKLGLVESELWYWYYANEMIFQAGQGKSTFTLIMYENLTQNPVEVLKALYQVAGLNFSSEIENKVLLGAKNSQTISSSWRKKLDNEELLLCDKFVEMAKLSFLGTCRI